jgi:hypothetical protein
VCFGPYTKVPDDPALRASAGQGAKKSWANYDPAAPSDWRWDDAAHGAFGAGAAAWYRLPPGRGMPTAPPGSFHCGTFRAGWLTGWHGAAGTTPDDGTIGIINGKATRYAVPADGRLPPAVGLPPADGAVCFDDSLPQQPSSGPCYSPNAVQAVGCGAFDLWSLPPTLAYQQYGYGMAYCLAA